MMLTPQEKIKELRKEWVQFPERRVEIEEAVKLLFCHGGGVGGCKNMVRAIGSTICEKHTYDYPEVNSNGKVKLPIKTMQKKLLQFGKEARKRKT